MCNFRNIAKKLSSQNQLKQLLAQLIQNSLQNHDFWVAQLIHLCTRLHAPPRYTTLIFDLAPRPDAFICSNMLKYHSQRGDSGTNEFFVLFDQMQKANVKVEAFVYPLLIKSCGKAGFQFHAHLLKRGLNYDQYIKNAVMGFYGKYGPIGSARELFDEMPERSSADWNSIVSGYWNWGNVVEAQKLFDLVPEKNVITWTAMVSGYVKVKDLESARWHFDQMPEKSTVSWNAMISGYAQNGLAQEAIDLFNEMISAGYEPDQTTSVTVISSCSVLCVPGLAESIIKRIADKGTCANHFVKTALLDMYAKCGNLEMARTIFDDLREHGNLVTWNAMIAAYTRVADLVSAMELFHQMPEKNVISWNSIIAGCSQNGESAMAMELFKEMIASKDLKPDEVTMASVISACGHLGALELGNWVTTYVSENQIKLSISGYNSLIFMYSKCGDMREARNVFEKMENRDVISYNTLITGFAAYGNGPEALEFLSKMKQESMRPDRITYIGVLTACSHSGLLEEGKDVFESIKDPDIDHYACMVDLYSRVGKLDEARRLIDSMPMHPHAGIYGSLLNASRVHKRIDLGEFAANKLFELEPENSGNYVLLSNIYASAGRWEGVDRVRGLMKAERVAKATGWSWVEHGGKLHRFIVGDHSHELSDDIYRILAEMKKKMMLAGYMADKGCVLRDVEEEEKEEMVGTQ